MVIYINSKKRLQIKSINFDIFTYSRRQYEKLTFKKCSAIIRYINNINLSFEWISVSDPS